MILSKNKLGLELRKAFDKVQKRIWIAVPFIGSWDSVACLTGTDWILKGEIDIRLLTDIGNEHFINQDTFDIFKQRAELKSLKGLHAKIYIIDEFILLTSANLTGTAFSKRFEIGIMLKDKNKEDIVSIFEEWWNLAELIDPEWKPRIKSNEKLIEELEDSNISGLKKLWNLPPKPHVQISFGRHLIVINEYLKFAKIYNLHGERLLKGLPLLQEVDSFFNYLFHEHPQNPSKGYSKRDFRQLSEKERINEFKDYFIQYKKWLTINPDFEKKRYESLKVIHNKLSKQNISNLTYADVKDITYRLHCMNSLPLNPSIFLNPNNNSLETIKNEWKELLHNDKISLEDRIINCRRELYRFGPSSVNELLGWYEPELYPIINGNSISGMRFFGYNINNY
jgi:hypothetical protein